MTNRDGPPSPSFGDHPHGAYWSAEGSPDEDGDESYEVIGTDIRFMPDHAVTVPLWDAGGVLPEEPAWLNQALGLSAGLVADLTAWGNDWNATSGGGRRFTAEQYRERQERLAAEAEALVQRLRAELPSRYTVTLKL